VGPPLGDEEKLEKVLYGSNGTFDLPDTHGPAYFDSDLTIQRSFNFREKRQLQFRLSGFNFLNHPLYAFGSYGIVAAAPGVEGDLWIGADHKVFHSTDSGVTFVTLEGMADVYTIGFGHPSPNNSIATIYMNGAAANTEGTFRSDDGGRDWIRVDDPQHQFGWKNAITGDPRVYGRVYLATGGRGIIYGEPSDIQ